MQLAQYLSPTEEVVVESHRHISLLAEDGAVFVVALALVALFPNRFIAFLAALAMIRSLWHALEWFENRILITNQRIIGVSGLLSRKVASIPLSMMTDLTYHRTLLGRVFGFGTIRAESAGREQGLSRITYIPHPDQFYRTLSTLLHSSHEVSPSPHTEAVEVDESQDDIYAEEAMAVVRRGHPSNSWDPDDTNPDMIVLP